MCANKHCVDIEEWSWIEKENQEEHMNIQLHEFKKMEIENYINC